MARLPGTRLIVRIAWRNVRRNWRHSLAALGTMAIGFLALAIFQGYLDELLRSQIDLIYRRNMLGDIMVRRPRPSSRESRIHPELYRLDVREQEFVERWIAAHPSDVRTRVRTLFLRGMANAGGSAAEFMAASYDVPEGRIARRDWAWNAWAGHPIADGEKNGALLSLGLAAALGCEPASDEPVMDPVTARLRPIERPIKCNQSLVILSATGAHNRVNALEAEVVGLTTASNRELDLRMMWMPIGFAQDLLGTKGISNFMIMLNDPAQAPRLRAELSAAVQSAGLPIEVVDWKETEDADLLRRGMQLLAVYRSLVVMVILIIAGAAVLTTMAKTVRERTREVGTLRSIGYRGRHVMAMFVVEAALLALYAGAVGMVFAVALSAAINAMHVRYKAGLLAEAIDLRIGYSAKAYALGFLFLAVVAVLAALVAARKVTRMAIPQALSDG